MSNVFVLGLKNRLVITLTQHKTKPCKINHWTQ